MTQAEINELLSSSGNGGGIWNAWGTNSYLGSNSDVNSQIRALKQSVPEDDALFKTNLGALKSKRSSAAFGAMTAALNGATGILGSSLQMSQIGDLVPYENNIKQVNQIGALDYDSYQDLASDYARLNNTSFNFDDETVRGASDSQKVGNVLSSTASGAMTGLTVGGPWGALAGGAIGLGAGLAGVFTGDAKAKREQARLESQAALAKENAQDNLNASAERIADRQFRRGVANIAESGGRVRRVESIEQFANRVLHRKPQQPVMESNNIVRLHKDGGLTVRIKRNKE